VNILDENIPEVQRNLLRSKRVPVEQIGLGIGRDGMQDEEIIPLLHGLDRPTFFTEDADFFSCRLCHERYCLVYLDIEDELIAAYIYRFFATSRVQDQGKAHGAGRSCRAGGIVGLASQ
jgi:hypothetical protein